VSPKDSLVEHSVNRAVIQHFSIIIMLCLQVTFVKVVALYPLWAAGHVKEGVICVTDCAVRPCQYEWACVPFSTGS